jgi:hypothetical protein
MYYKLLDSEMRSVCKDRIETLEYWLRRLIDDNLSKVCKNYFEFKNEDGNFLIKKEIRDIVSKRLKEEPERFSRLIDAILLDDEIKIICNPILYLNYFSKALKEAFPEGKEEARTFMKRLIYPRNCLSHANPISVRQAEQIVCYANDIIDSIKNYYTENNMNNEYNVPLILKMIDSFGNIVYRNQMIPFNDGAIMQSFIKVKKCELRPGDTLSVEVEVDSSFDIDGYSIKWSVQNDVIPDGKKAVICITENHVSTDCVIGCRITSNKNWHRLGCGADDLMALHYKVLPPI